jgi:hypothetical protein
MIDLKELLTKKGTYMILNCSMIQNVGLETAVILSYLVTRYRYFEEKKLLLNNQWFYCKREEIKINTGISEGKQRQIFKELEAAGLIKSMDKGIPLKRYYDLNFEEIKNLITADANKQKDSDFIENAKLQEQSVKLQPRTSFVRRGSTIMPPTFSNDPYDWD